MKSDDNIGAIPLGRVYRCPVCGAELSVIRNGKGSLRPVCCNTHMVQLKTINHLYVCSICGSELMVIRGGVKTMNPLCCNKKMGQKKSLSR
jgi:desulfoferrodoxin-like iron-binding protein